LTTAAFPFSQNASAEVPLDSPVSFSERVMCSALSSVPAALKLAAKTFLPPSSPASMSPLIARGFSSANPAFFEVRRRVDSPPSRRRFGIRVAICLRHFLSSRHYSPTSLLPLEQGVRLPQRAFSSIAADSLRRKVFPAEVGSARVAFSFPWSFFFGCTILYVFEFFSICLGLFYRLSPLCYSLRLPLLFSSWLF